MRRWFRDLDRILRGDATRLDALRERQIEIPLGGIIVMVALMALWYGACMGSYAGFRPESQPTGGPATAAPAPPQAPAAAPKTPKAGGPSGMQWFASTVKVPALFFLTLAVTFPSLYVFNALVGSRLNVLAVLQLLIASLAVNVAVLASLGPIVAFFSVSTTSYGFALLLNVLVFTISGFLGLAFLLQTLQRLSVTGRAVRPGPPAPGPAKEGQAAQGGEPQGNTPSEAEELAKEAGALEESPQRPSVAHRDLPPGPPSDRPKEGGPAEGRESQPEGPASDATLLAEEVGALEAEVEGHMLDRRVKSVFLCWMVIFAVVGAQMAWVLRPFVGSPSAPFEWFRGRESSFFEAVLQTVRGLFP
jgi:hypothetical protein